MLRLAFFITAALAATYPVAAQAPRALTQADYDHWRSIQGETLSPDGRWVVFTLSPQVGNGELVARRSDGTTQYRVDRGYTGRPQNQPNVDSSWAAPAAQVTFDSRHVVFLTYASQAEFERVRRNRRGSRVVEPRPSLAILSLENGRTTVIPGVRSFQLPRYGSRALVYHLEPDSTAVRPDSARPAESVAAAGAGGEARPVSGDSTRGMPRREFGSAMVIRDLATGSEIRVADVSSFTVSDSGSRVAYAVTSRTPERDGTYIRDLPAGDERAVTTGPGDYRQLVFDRSERQLAFVTNRDEWARRSADYRPRFALYLARLPTPARAVVEARDLAGGSIVSDRGRVSFTRDGSAVLFGTAPTPLDSIPADSLADKAIFDLWHWQDERLQPQQRVESRRDRIRSWVTIYHPAIDRHVQLANDTLRNVSVSEDGRIAVATTSLPYAVEAMWGDSKHDVYLIDARTGRRTQLVRGVRFGGGAQLSPSARYVTWFDSGQWNAWDVAAGRRISITAGIPVRLDQETWDTPSPPAPWGLGGWTKDDESVLVYDRYDIWQVDPSGRRAPRVLTDSAGRKSGLVFRVVDLDPEQRYFDRNEVLLLRTFNDVTKAAGFYEDRLGASTPPRPILMENRMFGTPKKAARATQYLVTRQTFREAPDLYSGPSLDRLTRISDANPQLKDFAWGTAQIVRWRSNDGIPLAGILYKPDGFDPAKKYPMVVYFYEQMSDNLHQQDMSYPRNTVKPAHYVSNGYLVFFPDIAYVKGYPGESALKSIVPGVQMLLDSGFVKEDGVGLSGQSWGGYQAAYIITRTNMFSAAFSGAPVANMTSAYGGIRWQTGIARPFQYETGQSRIGGSLWEYPFRYIENSPLFAADRVETPLLIMHNDADGAVPWYQGIEMFVALRRLGKEVYLLNYNDDGHNPRKRANQRDVAMRMKQFFDHHLAGAPAPEWMRRGIPFLQKGADQLSAPLAPAASGQGHDEVH